MCVRKSLDVFSSLKYVGIVVETSFSNPLISEKVIMYPIQSPDSSRNHAKALLTVQLIIQIRDFISRDPFIDKEACSTQTSTL